MTRPQGLDLDALRALRAPRRDLGRLRERIAEHLRDHGGYVAFSTGKDALVVLHLARQVDPSVPVVFFDSGLEYPETYDYLEELAEDWDLQLHIEPAIPSLLQILATHPYWTDRADPEARDLPLAEILIDQPAARAHALYGAGELWGVRAAEARGRAWTYLTGRRRAICTHTPPCTDAQRLTRHDGQLHRTDGTRAYGPIWDWTTDEVWAYIHRHDLPVNPVYAKLAALGVPQRDRRVSHLLDAAALDRGAAALLSRGWPSLYNQLATILPALHRQ